MLQLPVLFCVRLILIHLAFFIHLADAVPKTRVDQNSEEVSGEGDMSIPESVSLIGEDIHSCLVQASLKTLVFLVVSPNDRAWPLHWGLELSNS